MDDTHAQTDEETYRRGVLAEVDDARRIVVPVAVIVAAAMLVCGLIGFLMAR